jgi:hypothetical protein
MVKLWIFFVLQKTSRLVTRDDFRFDHAGTHKDIGKCVTFSLCDDVLIRFELPWGKGDPYLDEGIYSSARSNCERLKLQSSVLPRLDRIVESLLFYLD